MTPAVWFRRFAWLVCALLLAATAEASTRTLTADFDGDGRSDSVTIDRADPSILHISLSTMATTARIQRARAVLAIAAHDIDGDHRPELITAEAGRPSAAPSARALRVWKTDPRRGFTKVHPHRRAPGTFKGAGAKTLDDDPADDVTEEVTRVVPSRDSVKTRDPVALAPGSARIAPAPMPDTALPRFHPRHRSAPRAPPAPAPLTSRLA